MELTIETRAPSVNFARAHMSTSPHRPPVSARHAFALAFDLAVRRDALHSLIVPLILRSPWLLVLFLPAPATGAMGARLLVLGIVIAQSVLWWAVDAMLRFRARSVFNTPEGTPPMPVARCYAQGLPRLPWLYVTEAVRGAALAFAFSFLLLPGIFFGFRLAFATEAVVLDEANMAAAFARSWRLSEGRLERWLEMSVASVLLVIGASFVAAAVSLLLDAFHLPGRAVGFLVIIAVVPVIQYAWTFFYLRMIETEQIMRAFTSNGVTHADVPPVSASAAAGAETPSGEPTPEGATELAEQPPGERRSGERRSAERHTGA